MRMELPQRKQRFREILWKDGRVWKEGRIKEAWLFPDVWAVKQHPKIFFWVLLESLERVRQSELWELSCSLGVFIKIPWRMNVDYKTNICNLKVKWGEVQEQSLALQANVHHYPCIQCLHACMWELSVCLGFHSRPHIFPQQAGSFHVSPLLSVVFAACCEYCILRSILWLNPRPLKTPTYSLPKLAILEHYLFVL